MKRKFNHLLFLMFMGLMLVSSTVLAQTTIRGNVTDDRGEALIGANVIIKGTDNGDVTDIDGNYTVTTSDSYPLTLVFSYTGFTTQEIAVSSSAPVNVTLVEGILSDEVVISASRKREKVQEAPASISVLGSRQLETSSNTDATRNLINTPGVSITQQSAGRINVEMRAGVGLFGTSAFPIMDYRSLVGPGIGTFQSDAAGINNIDLARIEVVRGPGSALYGPGVTSGVIHFITKSPIDEPCTTVQASYGNMNTVNAAVRHAGANDAKTFGYKILASYNKGDEFTLDGTEGTTDAAGVFTSQLDKFRTSIAEPDTELGYINSGAPGTTLLTTDDIDPDGDGNMMQDFYENMAFSGHLEFRPQDDLSVFVSGGYNAASAVFYNDLGEGLAQSTEIWTQARVQKGGLFAQVFYVNNDGGGMDKPTFLYQTGFNAGIARQQLEGQVQYNFQTPSLLDADWTVGVDYRQAITDSGNRTYGRQEDNDDYNIVGGYLQGKFALGSKFDLVLAGRYDSFSFLDESFFSPRIALVYKPSPTHTFRASFNRAGAPPTGLQMSVDFPVNIPIPGVFDIWLAGMNDRHVFGDNPNIEFINQSVVAQGIWAALDPTGTNLGLLQTLIDLGDALPDQLPAGQLGQNGLSNAFVHQIASGSILAQIAAVDPSLVAPIQAYLESVTPSGNVGTFFGTNLFENNSPLNELIDAEDPTINISNTIEVGYKGLIGDKLGVLLDVYNVTSKGINDFTAIAPIVTLVGQDLTTLNGVAADFGAFLVGAGVDPALAGQLAMGDGQVANLVPNYYGTGTVETNLMPQNDGIMHVAAGYRIFPDAELNYTGIDMGLEYYISNDLSAWFNYSYISETEFSGEDLGESADSPLSVSLNTPQNKFRTGLIYAPETGFRGSVSFQHDDSFEANVGQYSGTTDEKNLVDLSIGYKFDNGLAVDLSGNNIFNNKYRAFVNMPEIGALYRAKVTYTFGCGDSAKKPKMVKADRDGDGIRDSKDRCPDIAGIKKHKGCPMSEADMAAQAAEEARMAAEAKAKMEMEAKARAEEQARMAAEAKAKAEMEAKARAEEQARMAAEEAKMAAEKAKETTTTVTSAPNAPTVTSGAYTHDHNGVSHSHQNSGEHVHRGESAVTGSATASDFKGGTGAYTHSHEGIGTHSHDNDGDHEHTSVVTSTGNLSATTVFESALQGINFRSGQDRFRSASYAIMDNVVTVLNQNPSMTVTIEGHTDSQGASGANKALSQKRANAVKSYLVSKGISSSRLTAIGYGEERPIADNKYSEGRAKNRRVVFIPAY